MPESWMERVEAIPADATRDDTRGLLVEIDRLRRLAREMAERLDALAERKTDDEVILTGTGASVRRVWEDAEVGRRVRESGGVTVYSDDEGNWWAVDVGTRVMASGFTPLAALQALAEAVKE